ncbi:hypothetical protein CRENBAI_009594 [Crenichthys baileyi]|uniref:Uncharacterized protein n=1 Tax=Crenichthys baileyi TaxID=28760 RepID=A0AAV9RUH4_9TELE
MLSPRPPPTPVRAREEAGRQKRAEESGSNSNSNELTARHTHSLSHTHCSALSLQLWDTRSSGKKKERRKEPETGGERQRETGNVEENNHGFRSGAVCDAAVDYITPGCGGRRNQQQRRTSNPNVVFTPNQDYTLKQDTRAGINWKWNPL